MNERFSQFRSPWAWAVLAALIPCIDHNNAHVSFLTDVGVYALLALGLNIVVGYAGLLDLGYAAFFAIGSYTYAMLASPHFGLHLPFWLIMPIAAIVTAISGLILGAPTLRLRGDYLAIVTLGFGEIIPQLCMILTPITNGPNGISALDAPSIFGLSFGSSSAPYYWLTLVMLVVVVLLSHGVRKSRLGRAWVAMREDGLASAFMGIHLTTAKLTAFALGAAIAGIAGVLYAAKLSMVSPSQFHFSLSIFVLSMLVLGGMGSLSGVLVGSALLVTLTSVVLPQANNLLAALHLGVDVTQFRNMFYGGILIAMMMLRPEGLLGGTQRRQEFREALTDPPISAAEHAYGPEVP